MLDPTHINANHISAKKIHSDIKQGRTEDSKNVPFNSRSVSKNVNSPILILIKGLWLEVLSMLSKPFSSTVSRRYAVASFHQDRKLDLIFTKATLKKASIGEARNIATNEVVRNNKDFEAAKSLLKKLKSKRTETEWFVDANATPASASTDGICAGIRIDIAQDFLVRNKSVEEIVAKNRKGGSADAAANQAVCVLMKKNLSRKQILLSDLLEPLKDLQNNQSEHSAFRSDFQGVGQILGLLDPEIGRLIRDKPELEQFDDIENSSSLFVLDLVDLIKTKEIPLPGKDLKTFAEKGLQALLKHEIGEDEIESFKWLVAFLECKQSLLGPAMAKKEEPSVDQSSLFVALKRFALRLFGNKPKKPTFTAFDNISDASRRFVLSRSILTRRNISAQNFISAFRDLSMRSLDIASSYEFSSDMEYLQQVRSLPEGVYGMSFDTGTGSHAITYIKNADGSGYILDPNRHQLYAKDMSQTLELFSELLSTYKKPNINNPLIANQAISHNLFLFVFEKLSE